MSQSPEDVVTAAIRQRINVQVGWLMAALVLVGVVIAVVGTALSSC